MEICKECGIVSGIIEIIDGEKALMCEKCGNELREI